MSGVDGRWLVTGGAGMLGRDLLAEGTRRGLELTGVDLAEMDITDRDAVFAMLREVRPAVIVNCAAFTNVDLCEAERESARRVNGDAVAHLAEGADMAGALLVQISTDFVFAGEKRTPYLEDDPTGPISEYGRSKLLGEENARRARAHLVVRTSWLYGARGWNFVEAIRKQVLGGKTELTVVDDQVGSPTATPDLSRALVDLVEAGARGTVHFSNSGAVSWFGYAEEIVRLHGWSAKVEVRPMSSTELGRPAPRPAWSVLDTTRFASLVGHRPRPWAEPLAEYVAAKPS